MSNWPKYDPRTGLHLCESCWNNQNWTHHCMGLCDCIKPGCNGYKRTPKIKFTGEGQTDLPDTGGEFIGPRAAEMAAQVLALKGKA